MKQLILAIILFSIAQSTAAQSVSSYEEAIENGVNWTTLDSIYVKAFSGDPAVQSAFLGREQEYIANYRNFIDSFMTFLNANNFFWEDTIVVFNRLYFDSNGKIEHWYYDIKEVEWNGVKREKFNALALTFARQNEFMLKADQAFQQCGTVYFYDH